MIKKVPDLKRIAKKFKTNIVNIQSWEEWNNCYFIKFHFGRPKFVSKKLSIVSIQTAKTLPTKKKEIESRLYRILAISKVRQRRYYGAATKSILMKNPYTWLPDTSTQKY